MKYILSWLLIAIVFYGHAQSKKEIIDELTKTKDSLYMELSLKLKKSNTDSILYSEKIKRLNDEFASQEIVNRKLTKRIDSLNSIRPKLEDYYLNLDYFSIDTSYENVQIEGKIFNIRILTERYDEYLELIKFDESDDFMNNRPRFILVLEKGSDKVLFVQKIDLPITNITLFKPNNELNREGRLYLNYISSGGGSGYTGELFSLTFDNGKIKLIEIVQFGELDLFLFNKYKSQIIALKGIWGNELDGNGDPIETHFSDHRYKITEYNMIDDYYEEKELGTTKYRYQGLDGESSALEIIKEILKKENFLTKVLVSGDFFD